MIRAVSFFLALAALVVATAPHSDFKLALNSVPAKPAARRQRIAAANPKVAELDALPTGTSEPLLDYFNGTDLQWYGEISSTC
jgi:hypothetical protein